MKACFAFSQRLSEANALQSFGHVGHDQAPKFEIALVKRCGVGAMDEEEPCHRALGRPQRKGDNSAALLPQKAAQGAISCPF